jgi:hypothetical protein
VAMVQVGGLYFKIERGDPWVEERRWECGGGDKLSRGIRLEASNKQKGEGE